MDLNDLKWNDFKQNVELHHSYLELAIKVNMFYYAVTGAILSFYFTHTNLPSMAKYALGLPFLLSVAFSFFFFWAAFLAEKLRANIRNTAHELGLKSYPEGSVLVLVCVIFGSILAVVSIALICFFFSQPFG